MQSVPSPADIRIATAADAVRGQHTRLLYPVQEAAQLLGVSAWTLRQMYYDCRIMGHKFANRLLIPAAEIDRIIKTSETPYAPSSVGIGAIAGRLSRLRAAARRKQGAASRKPAASTSGKRVRTARAS